MTNIFIESKKKDTPEYVFLETYVKHIGIPQNTYTIIPVDGKDALYNAVNINKMREAVAEGSSNIIIFDADFNHNNGGYSIRRNDIETKLSQHLVNASIFLFPNNYDDGDFESILENIMQKQKHQRFIDCFSDYEKCLGNDYHTPDRKHRLHTYMFAQKTLTKKQRSELGRGKWLFEDKHFWDIDNAYLKPLKDFLLDNIR